jgi:hypothetical protein
VATTSEKNKIKCKKWQSKNKDRIKEYSHNWYMANREKRLAQILHYDRAHPWSVRNRYRRWAASHKEYVQEMEQRKQERNRVNELLSWKGRKHGKTSIII